MTTNFAASRVVTNEQPWGKAAGEPCGLLPWRGSLRGHQPNQAELLSTTLFCALCWAGCCSLFVAGSLEEHPLPPTGTENRR